MNIQRTNTTLNLIDIGPLKDLKKSIEKKLKKLVD